MCISHQNKIEIRKRNLYNEKLYIVSTLEIKAFLPANKGGLIQE